MDTSESETPISKPEEATKSISVPDSELETEGLPESPATAVDGVQVTPPATEEEEVTKRKPIASSSAQVDSDEDEEEAQILRPPPAQKTLGQNYAFYTGAIASRPHGDLIDDVHQKWFWNFALLEAHHGYIQWLFPVFESSGMNMHSASLTKKEAKMIRTNLEAAFRVVRSYQLMLNFYGMRLIDMSTGEIERVSDYWQSRYLNLRMNSHNYLRINRILASLGHLGFNKYRRPLIEFLQREVRAEGSLISVCESSLSRFWEMALTPDSARYRAKTLETRIDRVDSVFFEHLKKNSPQFEEFVVQNGKWEESSSQQRKEAIEADIAEFEKWERKMRTRKAKAAM